MEEIIINAFRTLFMWIDKLAFGLVDDMYSLIAAFASAQFFDTQIIKDIMRNTYVLIFLFALFRVAFILVNAIISPDKLTEKGTGVSSVAKNIIIMFLLFIVVPFIFGESRQLQQEVVMNGYIGSLFGFDVGGSSNSAKGAGEIMKKIAVSSVVYPDARLIDSNGNPKSPCTDECASAINEYNTMMKGNDGNNKINFEMLTYYVNASTNIGGNVVYAYDYSWLISTIVGGYLTYLLLCFAIDIALRTVELAVLEILSPLFIATYIDPKSAKSGPFNNWVKTVGKTYVSLFIKLAIISLALMLISVMTKDETADVFKAMGGVGTFAKLLLLLAILMFAKKAPKWISDLIGIKGDDTGLGGLRKRLAGAAIIGGVATKAMDSAKNFAKQKGKNFVGNRARNTLARVGGMKEAMMENHRNKKNANGGKYDKTSVWRSGRDAAKQSKLANYGQNINGLKDVAAGYLAGRQNVNKEAQSLKDSRKEKYGDRVKAYENKVGLTEAAKADKRKIAEDNSKAKKLYGKLTFDSSGDRKKLAGRDAYLNPQGRKEMNKSFGNPLTTAAAYTALGLNLASDRNLKVGQIQDGSGNTVDLIEYGKNAISASGYKINDYGKVVDSSGNVISSSLVEYSKTVANGNGHVIVDENVRDANGAVVAANLENYGKENMSYSGTLAIEHLVAENKQSNVQRYQNSVQQYSTAVSEYSSAVGKYNEAKERAVSEFKTTDEYKTTAEMSNKLRNAQEELEKVKKQYQAGDLRILAAEKAVKDSEVEFINAKTISDTKFKTFQKNYLTAFEQSMNDAAEAVETWRIEKASATSLVKDYEIEVNGDKLSPIDNFARINEINSAISMEVSKKKEKYDNSLKNSSSDK